MAFPELYRFGREGRHFGIKLFAIFMFEGVFQVWSFTREVFTSANVP